MSVTPTAELPRLPWRVPPWHERGACQLFQDDLDWIEAKPKTAQALACKTICAACPVRYDCALAALERGEPNGIWGGLDREDRKQVAKAFRFPTPGNPPPHGTNSRRVKWGCDCVPCKDAHALYERERRIRARQRAAAAAALAAASPAPRLRLNLAEHHRRYRRRTRRRR